MLTNTNRMRYGPWLAAITMAMLSPLGSAVAGDEFVNGEISTDEPIKLTLTLEPPSPGINQFNISADLNTLVPGGEMQNAGGVVEWSGSFEIDLYLSDGDGIPSVMGLALSDSGNGIEQSPIVLSYGNLPVGVQFTTTSILNQMQQLAPLMVNVQPGSGPQQFVIAPDEFGVMQKSGEAAVSIEERPTEMQEINDEPPSMMDIDSPSLLLLQPLLGFEQPMYKVSLKVPMAGTVVDYMGTGLPVEWEYTSGDLVATSELFAIGAPIPEPTTLTLAALLAGAGAWWVRRAG